MDRIDVLMKTFIATFGAFLRVLFWEDGMQHLKVFSNHDSN